MKKIITTILILFLVLGCGKSTLIENISTVNTISLYTNDNKYLLNEDKYEEFVNAINSYEYKEDLEEIDTTWKIEIELETDRQIYYLNPDGSIIDSNNRRYTTSQTNISELYKKALGKNIFQGEIIESNEWISNYETFKKMFSFNMNKVDEISVNINSKSYNAKDDEIIEFVEILNDSNYLSYEDGLTYGYVNSFIKIKLGEEIYKINFYSSQDVYVAKVIVDKDKDGVAIQERTYFLDKDSTLVQLYNQIIEEMLFTSTSFSFNSTISMM